MSKIVFLLISFFSFSHYYHSQNLDLNEAVRLTFPNAGEFEEIGPIYNSTTNELFFVRIKTKDKLPGNWDQEIWVSNLNLSENNLENIHPLKELNNRKNNSICGINFNGTKLFLLNNYSRTNGLAFSEVKDGNFLKPTLIVIPNLTIKSANYGFYVHPDENTIIVSYMGAESVGQEDLYLIEKKDNKWSEPRNLGDLINTTGFEISPFLTKNKDTLYFASNGHKNSYGGADIYYSTLDKMGKWSEPQNVGPEINTAYFDAYLIQIENKLIWSSTKENKNANLYTSTFIPPPILQAFFSKKEVSKLNGTDGEIHLDSITGIPPFKFSWSNGMQTSDCFQLRKGTYTVKITDNKGQQVQQTIILNEPELQVNDVIRIPEIRYESDSWKFVTNHEISSLDSLKFIAELLKNHPTLVIRLISHTDSRGEEKKNLKLSENRSRACYKYLVEQLDVDPRRIIPVGMGEKEPARLLDNATKKEIILSEDFINQFKGNLELTNKYNQLNRRTEGKVERLNFKKDDPAAPQSYFEFQDLN